MNEQTSPSRLTRQATYLAVSIIREGVAIANGVEKVSDDERDRRLDICRTCEHLDPKNGSRCLLCKCYLRRKTAWRTTQCPISKW